MSSADEVVLRTLANLWQGDVSVGGRLILTTRQLSFRSHALNLEAAGLDIPVRDIVGTGTYRSLGVIPNGLTVRTRAGTDYRFVVWKRRRLIEKIAELTS
jgi:hypothetical protein